MIASSAEFFALSHAVGSAMRDVGPTSMCSTIAVGMQIVMLGLSGLDETARREVIDWIGSALSAGDVDAATLAIADQQTRSRPVN